MKTKMISTAALLLGGMLATGAWADTAPRVLTVDDTMKLEAVGSPAISPDGRWIAYRVYGYDLEGDRGASQIWMVSADGKEKLPMTAPATCARSPRWSPDGRYLAFLANKEGEGDDAGTQVWLLDRRGGEAIQHTKVKGGVDDYLWSPDGSRMLLTITDREPEAEKGKDGKDKPKPWVIDRLQFKQDGVGYLDRRRAHLYLYDGKGEPEQITFGDYDDESPAWSPDGKSIAFESNRTAEPDGNVNSDVWIVSAEAGLKDRPLRQLTNHPGQDGSPAWSPDGKSIAYTTVTTLDKIWYATQHLAVIPAEGGTPKVLTADYDRMVYKPEFTPNGKAVLAVAEDAGEFPLISVDVKSGKVTRLDPAGGDTGDFAISKKGEVITTRATPERPDALGKLGSKGWALLDDRNAERLAGITLASVQKITAKSADGTPVEAYLYLPPNYVAGTKMPLILRPHGGPVAQHSVGFDKEMQVLAAAGYAVLAPNPRGSTGHGEDFSAAIFAEWGVKDFADEMAAVDEAIAMGVADADKLGVGGWSYGGIMTNYVITKSTRFKAAISGASEVNYTANYGHDIYQLTWEAELGLPWESRETWEKINPFNDVGKVTTPTLVMGGKEDWNVPIQNSEQLYQALKRRGIPTELVVYPDEDHGIDRPSFVKDRYQRYIAWYDCYVLGKCEARTAGAKKDEKKVD
ncbi:S9 family peptidase [Gimibacter soli]|uniref:S9 family peptidase n=1 Tax=Gimibacter soli TaxID=3024400 RepID=A0AAF0BLD2_9PROT|nr:S9 family peptidase [Gimibacter soli]WCL55334.1 S9 family peptidase [Gimibacter soli]